MHIFDLLGHLRTQRPFLLLKKGVVTNSGQIHPRRTYVFGGGESLNLSLDLDLLLLERERERRLKARGKNKGVSFTGNLLFMGLNLNKILFSKN